MASALKMKARGPTLGMLLFHSRRFYDSHIVFFLMRFSLVVFVCRCLCFRKKFHPDDSDIDGSDPGCNVLKGDQSDGGWSSGTAVQNTTSGLPSVCIRTATIRAGSTDGNITFQVTR